MRTILILYCLLGLSLSYIYTVPCGRCVGLGQPCVYDSCTYGLVCKTVYTPQGGPAATPVCVNEVPPGKYCDGQKAFDPCPANFVCDRTYSKNCIPSSAFAEYNDGCLDDTYCKQGLSCKKGICRETNYTQCTSDTACPVNKYCNFTQGIVPGVIGICVDLPSGGQSCLGQCKDGYSCNRDSLTCQSWFTLAKGSNCSDSSECASGLQCYLNPDNGLQTCVNPGYHFVGGINTVAWGYECADDTLPGCNCNYASKQFQYYKESTILSPYTKPCISSYNTFYSCLDSNICKFSLGDSSCLRKNCYNQYRNVFAACYDPSLFPTICGANSLILFFGLLLLVLIV